MAKADREKLIKLLDYWTTGLSIIESTRMNLWSGQRRQKALPGVPFTLIYWKQRDIWIRPTNSCSGHWRS